MPLHWTEAHDSREHDTSTNRTPSWPYQPFHQPVRKGACSFRDQPGLCSTTTANSHSRCSKQSEKKPHPARSRKHLQCCNFLMGKTMAPTLGLVLVSLWHNVHVIVHCHAGECCGTGRLKHTKMRSCTQIISVSKGRGPDDCT